MEVQMLAYLRRLLEPPRFMDIWLYAGIFVIIQLLTKYLLLGFVLFFGMSFNGLPLAVLGAVVITAVALCFFLGHRPLAAVCVALGAELVVLSLAVSSVSDEDKTTYVAVGTIAAIVSIAILSESERSRRNPEA